MSLLFIVSFVLLNAITARGQCPTPDTVADATHDGSAPFPVGTVITYRCGTGFTLAGPDATRTCQNDETWTDAAFECRIDGCGIPGSPSNGEVNYPSTSFGATATYTCNTGYNLVGDDERFCFSSGGNTAWTPDSVPDCEVVICPTPIAPENGRFDDGGITDYEFGTRITYICDAGYALSDPALKEARCNEQQNWGVVPECLLDYNCAFENRDQPVCGYQNEGWDRDSSQGIDPSVTIPTFVVKSAVGSTSALTSAMFDVPAEGACVRFYYRIDSTNSNNLTVQLLTSGTVTKELLNVGRNAQLWTRAEFNLEPGMQDVQWSFQVENSQDGNIALDEISLARGPCRAATVAPTTASVVETTTDSVVETTTDSIVETTTDSIVEPTGIAPTAAPTLPPTTCGVDGQNASLSALLLVSLIGILLQWI